MNRATWLEAQQRESQRFPDYGRNWKYLSDTFNYNRFYIPIDDIEYRAPDTYPYVVIYDRVSTEKQRPDMERRKHKIFEICRQNGLVIVGYFSEVAPGWSNHLLNRVKLQEAVACAKRKQVTMIAPSLDRLVRHGSEKFHDQYAPLRRIDSMRLREIIKKVPVATIIPPNASIGYAHGELSKWGQVEGNAGGNGHKKKETAVSIRRLKKEKKAMYLPVVLRMSSYGATYGEMVRILAEDYEAKLAKSTIRDWIKNHKAEEQPSFDDFIEEISEMLKGIDRSVSVSQDTECFFSGEIPFYND